MLVSDTEKTVGGARAKAREQGWGALPTPAAPGCGSPVRRELSALCPSAPALQRRAAGLGGAAVEERAGRRSRAASHRAATPRGSIFPFLASFPHPQPARRTLPLPPPNPSHSLHPTPDILGQSVPPSDSTPL